MPEQKSHTQNTQTTQQTQPSGTTNIQIHAEVEAPVKSTLAGTVAQYIGAVMEDPGAMRILEANVMTFINNDDRSPERKLVLLQQLTRGRQAMESLHSLMFQGY